MTSHSKRNITSMTDHKCYILYCGNQSWVHIYSLFIYIHRCLAIFWHAITTITHSIYTCPHRLICWRDPSCPIISHPLPFPNHQFPLHFPLTLHSLPTVQSLSHVSLSWLGSTKFLGLSSCILGRQPNIPKSHSCYD
jgi:hypothetical protein